MQKKCAKVTEFNVNLFYEQHGTESSIEIYLGSFFLLTLIRPWNKFENGYINKCGRFYALLKRESSLFEKTASLKQNAFNLNF